MHVKYIIKYNSKTNFDFLINCLIDKKHIKKTLVF